LLTSDDEDALVELCRRLDGLPLAIELAAARSRALSPRQIADGLESRFELLSNGPRTVPARQATLRASMDWSYELLGEERAVFRHLAVFAGSFDVDAVIGVYPAATAEQVAALSIGHSCWSRMRLSGTVTGYWRPFAPTPGNASPRPASTRKHVRGTASTTWRWPRRQSPTSADPNNRRGCR